MNSTHAYFNRSEPFSYDEKILLFTIVHDLLQIGSNSTGRGLTRETWQEATRRFNLTVNTGRQAVEHFRLQKLYQNVKARYNDPSDPKHSRHVQNSKHHKLVSIVVAVESAEKRFRWKKHEPSQVLSVFSEFKQPLEVQQIPQEKEAPVASSPGRAAIPDYQFGHFKVNKGAVVTSRSDSSCDTGELAMTCAVSKPPAAVSQSNFLPRAPPLLAPAVQQNPAYGKWGTEEQHCAKHAVTPDFEMKPEPEEQQDSFETDGAHVDVPIVPSDAGNVAPISRTGNVSKSASVTEGTSPSESMSEDFVRGKSRKVFTVGEKLTVFRLVQDRLFDLDSKSNTAESQHRKKAAWQDITSVFNVKYPKDRRSLKSIRKLWLNMKNRNTHIRLKKEPPLKCEQNAARLSFLQSSQSVSSYVAMPVTTYPIVPSRLNVDNEFLIVEKGAESSATATATANDFAILNSFSLTNDPATTASPNTESRGSPPKIPPTGSDARAADLPVHRSPNYNTSPTSQESAQSQHTNSLATKPKNVSRVMGSLNDSVLDEASCSSHLSSSRTDNLGVNGLQPLNDLDEHGKSSVTSRQHDIDSEELQLRRSEREEEEHAVRMQILRTELRVQKTRFRVQQQLLKNARLQELRVGLPLEQNGGLEQE